MTRKYYTKIASDFKAEVDHARGGMRWWDNSVLAVTLKGLASRLADTFKEENSRFDKEKFITACGL